MVAEGNPTKLAFMGEIGMFTEMPRKKDITESDYENILNKSFFLGK